METLNIVIVEDDDILRNAFLTIIKNSGNLLCTGSYDCCETAIENLKKDEPDVILMDLNLPGISGIEGIRKIKKIKHSIDIIVITVHNSEAKVFEAICAGACGYLVKNVPEQQVLRAIWEAHNGGAPMNSEIARMIIESFHKNINSPLSNRESEVLGLMAKGKSYSMIADELFINKETVRFHIKNIYYKLGVHSKSDALSIATKEKLI